MDSSEVGKFGTLRLMKRLEPDKVVASFPIDDDEITLGRDPTCSIRLYYDAVSPIHCKIIMVERTNGLFVDGCPVFPATASTAAPVTVPLPNNSTIEVHQKRFQFCYPPKELRAALLSTPTPTSTPDKRRRRRTLRMSMIQSAQVFTPRPSQDPKENLRILQTPLRTPFRTGSGNRRESSPLKRGAYVAEEEDDDDEEELEEDIVLVEGNHPRVVEEDRDLVILEHVVVREPEPAPQHLVQFPIPQSAQPPPQAPQTPRPSRRAQSRASLHRAVLIRSAHRTALKLEMEREEEEDVEEVEETIQSGAELEEETEEDERDEKQQNDASVQQNEGSGALSGWRKSLSGLAWPFRASASPAPREEEKNSEQQQYEDHGEENDDEQDDTGEEQDIPKPTPFEDQEDMDEEEDDENVQITYSSPRIASQPVVTPPTPRLHIQPQARSPHKTMTGPFMTPQVPRGRSRGPVRYSVGGFTPGGIHGAHLPQPPLGGLGMAGSSSTSRASVGMRQDGSVGGWGSGPRRVRLVEPWKVEDIVVPVAGQGSESDGSREFGHQGENGEDNMDEDEENRPSAYESVDQAIASTPSTPMRRKEKLSEEERQAILDRRRSALQTPDAFFGGQAPGARRLSLFPLSPTKPTSRSELTSTPLPAVAEAPSRSYISPVKRLGDYDVSEVKEEDEDDHERENMEDTSVLLARMKQMVEGVKRRQSMGPRPSVGSGSGPIMTPRKSRGFSLLAPDAEHAFAPTKTVVTDVDEEEEEGMEGKEGDSAEESDKENDIRGDLHAQGSRDEEIPQEQEEQGHDIEMESEDGLVESGPLRTEPTPRFEGMRHMFSIPREETGRPSFIGVRNLSTHDLTQVTPRMNGMRELFQTERVMATPAFEGVGDMLATPPAFKASDSQQEATEKGKVQEQQEPRKPPAASRAPRGRKPATSSRIPASAPRTAPVSKVVFKKDLSTVEEGSRATRKPRLRSADPDPIERPEPPATEPVARVGRRTRKATESPPLVEDPAPAIRVHRKTRAARTPTPEVSNPVPPPTTSRRVTRTRAASVEDTDPLDSIARAVSPEIPLPENTTGKVRRSARGKITAVIKEEDEDETSALSKQSPEEVVRTDPPRVGRPRKAPAAAAPTGIPRSGARGVKTPAAPKKSSPAQTSKPGGDASATAAGGKENTPERQLELTDDEQPDATTSGKPTAPKSGSKTKVTRNAGKVHDSTEEVQEKGQTDTTTRIRVSRAKTKK
ncbi:hypothetical protein PHLCEN_2v1736 [Hermanssonia centrifuga]|uniref:FHA domain-containing protein n=1 Tax=Hermanssonia centrifuga TaxID=98765 RepID=A0A2R6RW23_9APHY|nr:hypothetical protein PHLCEN_2v1736 [Hermanssonia centrifuga]